MITLLELTKKLIDLHASTFVGFLHVAEPEMRKANNPFIGKVLEVSRVNGTINWQYKRAVNRQRKREGKPQDFKPEPRVWGKRLQCSPLVVHLHDEPFFYLEVSRERIERWFYDIATLKPVPETELQPYFPKRGKSRQGVDREIVLRDYRLDRIGELTLAGETFRVDPAWWQLQCLRLAGAAANREHRKG